MKKTLLLFVFVLSIGVAARPVSSADTLDIPVRVSKPGGHVTRTPDLIPFSCVADTEMQMIGFSFQFDIGDVIIEIENLTTGDYSQTTIDSSIGGSVIPFSASSGSWRITISLESGVVYIGEFYV